MKYVTSVYLWTAGFIYFVFVLVFVLIISYIFPERKYNPWLKGMLRFLFKLMLCPVEVKGAEQIHPEQTYLYMANHVSLFDIPLLAGFTPGFVRGVEAHDQHKWPLYGSVVRRLGNVPIERDNAHTSISSIHKVAELVKNGKSMVILPEGHRTLDGKMRQFKKLPFYLAKKAEHEIVPIGLSGLFHLKKKGSWHIHPTKLLIKFGNTITVDTIQSLSITELRDLVRNEIQGLIEQP